MHRINFVKSSEAVENLFQEIGGLILSQPLFLIEVAFQIASVAVLHSYELCPLGAPSVNVPDHILVVTLFEDSDFGGDELLQFGGVNHEFSGDGFDSDGTVGVLVEGLVDNSPGSFPQFPHEGE